ncbi:hypothetical protein [Microbacterium sp. BH-3-3-3]|uniref:hypothetical protein n=1 Tax=Microbacterium sp. BH-3-3-3 TaxID=1906742 RepID=UPI00164341D7|nr:hypothetical protein [Microbacterium sp. BH-3-3-3]
MSLPTFGDRSALQDDAEDEIAGFAPACSSCGGVIEPVQRGAAAWWACHRCRLVRIA